MQAIAAVHRHFSARLSGLLPGVPAVAAPAPEDAGRIIVWKSMGDMSPTNAAGIGRIHSEGRWLVVLSVPAESYDEDTFRDAETMIRAIEGRGAANASGEVYAVIVEREMDVPERTSAGRQRKNLGAIVTVVVRGGP